MYCRDLTKQEKERIAAVCDRFIAETLLPRFLPEIRPAKFNFPVGISGRWRGADGGAASAARLAWRGEGATATPP